MSIDPILKRFSDLLGTGDKSHLLQYIIILVSMRLLTACSQIFCLVLVMIWSHGAHRHAVEMGLVFNLCSSFLLPPSAKIPGVCPCPASVGFNEAWLGILGGSPENISAWSCSNWSFHVWILTLKNKKARCKIFLENRFFPLNLLSIVFFCFHSWQTINTVSEVIRGCQVNQDYFASVNAPSNPPR